jgi:hypothetical protein
MTARNAATHLGALRSRDATSFAGGEKVLISSEAVPPATDADDSVHLNLTRDEIRNSPLIDSNPQFRDHRIS